MINSSGHLEGQIGDGDRAVRAVEHLHLGQYAGDRRAEGERAAPVPAAAVHRRREILGPELRRLASAKARAAHRQRPPGTFETTTQEHRRDDPRRQGTRPPETARQWRRLAEAAKGAGGPGEAALPGLGETGDGEIDQGEQLLALVNLPPVQIITISCASASHTPSPSLRSKPRSTAKSQNSLRHLQAAGGRLPPGGLHPEKAHQMSCG
ncbi:unnamed protein product [Prorocentrum cordatum]|uniref:Uncharacterized protein n=1 Tax=Prorocentrum cordatum TaxID=2364126 RepID=A0ABN9QLC7_9DINO|nr:unnamed protein product [Polarella glacialis]